MPSPPWPVAERTRSIGRLVPAVLMFSTVACVAAARGESREGEALFESKVRPLLVAKCQECHGAGVAEAGLRLDSRRGLLLGGDSGAIVVPGDAAKSRLLDVVKHVDELAMPPDAKLSDDEIAVLEEWVSVGVPWTGPGGEEAGGASREEAMRERLEQALASHWAFRAPERHEAPRPAADGPITAEIAAAWSRSPIDRFIVAELAARALAPAPEATARDLFRRVHYDLTGLPPRPPTPMHSPPIPRTRPTVPPSNGCSPPASMPSTGRGTGSTWLATPTRWATQSISRGSIPSPGPTATGSYGRSTTICPTTGS